MKFSPKIGMLLIDGAKQCGKDPSAILMYIEEQLTFDEYAAIEEFLNWVVSTKRTYGYNVETVWNDWLQRK